MPEQVYAHKTGHAGCVVLLCFCWAVSVSLFMTNKSRKVKSRLAHQAHDGAVDGARDAQAADVGVAGGHAQRDPLYALGIGRGRRGRRCRERGGGGARTAARRRPPTRR